MQIDVTIRRACEDDRAFIFELSPRLAEVARLTWHTESAMKKMQDDYIAEMLAETGVPNATLIAEVDGVPLGFIHVRTHKNDISGETCGTVPLLAVLPRAQGMGIGKRLMASAEQWAKALGCRLLQLEVFANNAKANSFYRNLDFHPEILQMTKEI